jgi:DNA-binding transcriptional LysR family regulator
VIETAWIKRLNAEARPSFVSDISLVLSAAARASAGLAVLPRYLGDSDLLLRRIPMPDAPSEAVWLTVHRDLKDMPRVRVLLDFLASSLKQDELLLQPA